MTISCTAIRRGRGRYRRCVGNVFSVQRFDLAEGGGETASCEQPLANIECRRLPEVSDRNSLTTVITDYRAE